jgi:succinate dehydrogenase / fumarate reductase cytochrome b subunit
MSSFKTYLNSSIGKKTLMAITGAIMSGFLVAHLSGNLLLYLGAEAFNSYAYNLHLNPVLVWIVRIVLLVSFPLHIYFGIRLKIENRLARPIAYRHPSTVQASWASRYMIVTGMVLLGFILFHLAHYTLFLVHPEFGAMLDEKGRHDAYKMAVTGFQNIYVSIFYIFSMIALALHLNHGLSSMFQSMGVNHNKYNFILRKIAPTLAIVLAIGFLSIPISVMCGVISLEGVTP